MMTAQTQTSVKATLNTFSDGLEMDFNDLLMPASALTNCLNGTTVTYNGNEFVLLNDMGNGRVGTAYLPAGYVPVGIKEHGGVIYVAATNPLTRKGQIGSFPSPERTTNDGKRGQTTSISNILTDTKTSVASNTTFRSGDKFVIELCDGTNDYTYYKKLVSNCYNISNNKISSPKKKFIDLDLAVLNSSNGYVSIVPELNRYDLSAEQLAFITNIDDTNILQNAGFWALFNKTTTLNTNADLTADSEIVDSAILADTTPKQIYNEKIFGKLKLISKVNTINSFNVSYKTYIDSNDNYKVKMQIKYTYNCPDGLYSNNTKIPNITVLLNGNKVAFTSSDLYNTYSGLLGNSDDFDSDHLSLYGCKLTYTASNDSTITNTIQRTLITAIDTDNADFTTKKGSTITVENYLYWYDIEENLYTFIDTYIFNMVSTYIVNDKVNFSILPYLHSSIGIPSTMIINGTFDFTDTYISPELTTWKFYYGSGGLTINWGLKYKLEEDEEISKVVFNFYGITESSKGISSDTPTLSYTIDSGMNSYNGIFYETLSDSDLPAGYAYVVKIDLYKNGSDDVFTSLKAWALTTSLYNDEYESGTGSDNWTESTVLNANKLNVTLTADSSYTYTSNPQETTEATYTLGSTLNTYQNVSTKSTSYVFDTDFTINNSTKYPTNLEFTEPTVSYVLSNTSSTSNVDLTYDNGQIVATLKSGELKFNETESTSVLVRNVFKPYSSTTYGSTILKWLKCSLDWSKSGNNHVNYNMDVYNANGTEKLTSLTVDQDFVKSKDNDNYLSDFYDNITYLVGSSTNIIKLSFGKFTGLLMQGNDNTWCIISSNSFNIPTDFSKIYVSTGPATKTITVPKTDSIASIATTTATYTPTVTITITPSNTAILKLGSAKYSDILSKFSEYPIANLNFTLSTSVSTKNITLESETIEVEGPNEVLTEIKTLVGSGCDVGWMKNGTGDIELLSSTKYDSSEIYMISSGVLTSLPTDVRCLLQTETISNQTAIYPASVLKTISDSNDVVISSHDRKWHLKGTPMWPDLNI